MTRRRWPGASDHLYCREREGGELRGEGDLPASPSLNVENRDGDWLGRAVVGRTYGENLWDLTGLVASGDFGERAGREVERKGELSGAAEAAEDVLTMAASSAGLYRPRFACRAEAENLASSSGERGREGMEAGGGREGGSSGPPAPALYIIIILAFSAAAIKLLLSSPWPGPPKGGRM